MSGIVIFGATSGIAQAVCREFAARGTPLFLVGRDEQKLQRQAEDLKVRTGTLPQYMAMDFASHDAHKATLDQAWDRLGGYDGVLIAHGSLPDQKGCESNWSDTKAAFEANFLSAASLAGLAANRLEPIGKGTIAVITSVAGDRGRQSNYIYGAAKGGLSLFLQGLRNRLAPRGVAVIDIRPGFVDTAMTAHLKKGPLFAKPETVAKTIVRLFDKPKDVAYVPWFWFIIMTIIRSIPERVFKRMKL